MKFRNGFVSNSSSCSFTCPACLSEFSGYDWDEDPVCPRCGIHIQYATETFLDYLIRKYNIDKQKEMNNFLIIQREEERQARIKYGDIDYD